MFVYRQNQERHQGVRHFGEGFPVVLSFELLQVLGPGVGHPGVKSPAVGIRGVRHVVRVGLEDPDLLVLVDPCVHPDVGIAPRETILREQSLQLGVGIPSGSTKRRYI